MQAKNELREIKLWVRDMIYKYHVAFHPDTPIADYINLKSGEQTFTKPAPLQHQLDRFFLKFASDVISTYIL